MYLEERAAGLHFICLRSVAAEFSPHRKCKARSGRKLARLFIGINNLPCGEIGLRDPHARTISNDAYLLEAEQ